MRLLFLTLLTILSIKLYAQGADTDSVQNEDKKNVIVLPALYYSPETSLGFGGAGIFYFREKGSKTNPSSIQTLFIYTLEQQIQWQNEYEFFINDEIYWINGELSFFIYPYEFYGIGSDILTEAVSYSASYLNFEFNGLREIKKDFYIGPTLWLDHYFKIDIDSGSALDSENILGTDPSKVAGYGLSFILDKRNNVFSPSKGYYLQGRVLNFEEKLIGDFAFTDLFIDARKYFHPWNKLETAFNFYHQSVIGTPPFYNYALMGGSKLMRGYYKGAYRDNHQTVLQGELRVYPLDYWLFSRVVFSVFGGVGSVTNQPFHIDKLLGSYGFGFRFDLDPEEKLRIRLDYARGYNTDGIYININEAF